MTGTTWKAHERRTAKRLGGQRLGATGASTPDVIAGAGHLLIECKQRAVLPAWLTAAARKIRQHAAAAGPLHLGVVVLHQTGQRSDDDLVVVGLKDWLAWYGGAELATDDNANMETTDDRHTNMETRG